MRKRTLGSAAALAGAVALTMVLAGAAPAIDYDEAVARGAQLATNGSFETEGPNGDAPEGWGVPKDTLDRFEYVSDPKTSKHGSRYLKWTPEKPRYLYGGLDRVPAGRLRASAWARGEGEFAMVASMRRHGWRTKSEAFLETLGSPKFKLTPGDWKEYTWDFEVKESYEIDGQAEKPDHVQFKFFVRGALEIDQIVVAPVEAYQAAKPAKTPAAAADDAGAVDGLDLRPVVTIPRLDAPPTIDGTMSEGEWVPAAAVTGFTEVDQMRLAERQATAFIGYDDERLYMAFHCPHRGRIMTVPPERDPKMGHDTEVIEVWLAPPDKPWVHFLGMAGGAILDVSQDRHAAWNGVWDYKETIVDIHEEIGGILAFDKKVWTAEFSIRFADLGVATPAPGEAWRVNFTRDYGAPKGEKRSADDWTTWAPIRGRFNSIEQFGFGVFRPDSPPVRWLEIGDLPNGDLRVKGEAGGVARVTARARFQDADKTLSIRSREIGKEGGAFDLQDTLKVNTRTPLLYELEAVDPESNVALAVARIPFTARAALDVKAVPVFFRETLCVHADASRVADLPGDFVVEAAVFRGDTALGREARANWTSAKARGDLTLSLKELAPGEYAVKVFVRAEEGAEPIVASTASFTVPEKPDWMGNTLGVSDDVPAPWTPVEVDGARVGVTERVYLLTEQGLPAQITAKGADMLAAPATLTAVVDGKRLAWKGSALRQTERRDAAVTWRIDGALGPMTVRGELTVEFDGYAEWKATVGAERPVSVERLSLDFPLLSERALYARGGDATMDDYAAFFAMFDPAESPETVKIAGSVFCFNGWPWTDQWTHRLWLGDDARGLMIMCETEAPLRGRKRTTIEDDGPARVMSVHLIDGPHRLEGELDYLYMWQATPVRPLPEAPERWHASYGRRVINQTLIETKVENPLFTILDMWALLDESHPEHRHSQRLFDKANKVHLDAGVKVVPYSGMNLVTTDRPELAPFRPGWETYPQRVGTNPTGGWVLSCPENDDLVDYKVAMAERFPALGMEGLYLDVSGVTACKNHCHGCGWFDEAAGEWRPTIPIRAHRDLYRRVYRVYKRDGADNILFRHGVPVAAVAGFVDVTTQGEEWGREGIQQYDRLTPKIFRVKQMQIQYGIPTTWYVFHHYHRGIKHGGRVPLSAILAYCLPHCMLPTAGHPGMWPVWEATDRFWTSSEFIPYWSDDSPVTASPAGPLATVYLQRERKRAWVVVSNWTSEPVETTLSFDWKTLGMNPDAAKVSRALEHPLLQPEDDPASDPMKNTPLALKDGRLTLSLAGRNLELVSIEAE